jgi:hypothetical protein
MPNDHVAIGLSKLKPGSQSGSHPIGLRNPDQLTPDQASIAT